jgi:hypothetical protein
VRIEESIIWIWSSDGLSTMAWVTLDDGSEVGARVLPVGAGGAGEV